MSLFILDLFAWSVYTSLAIAEVAELADAHDSNSCSARSVGSIPTFGTAL